MPRRSQKRSKPFSFSTSLISTNSTSLRTSFRSKVPFRRPIISESLSRTQRHSSTHLEDAGLDGQGRIAVGAQADLRFDPCTEALAADHAAEQEADLVTSAGIGLPVGSRLRIELYPVG